MTLIAHIADVHLGYAQYGLEEREEDVYEAFEEAVELMKKEHVDMLLIAGDLFDSPKPPIKALMKARKLLTDLRNRGVEIFHILGDHELPRRLSELPPTALLSDSSRHVALRVTESSNGIAVTGLDRTPPTRMKESLESLKKLTEEIKEKYSKSILLAHVPAHRPEKGFELLPPGYGYYALGHEHERKVLSKAGAPAAYPGSMEILSSAEIDAWERNGKGFLIVDYSKSEPLIHEVNLKSVRPQRMIEVKTSLLDDAIQDALNWTASLPKKPIIHLRILGETLDRASISRKLQETLSGKVLYYRHEFVEEGGGEVEAESIRGLDVRSMIREYMALRGFGEDEIELALEIYDAYLARGAEEVERVIARKLEEKVK
ncbi:MAG: DNA repair exonuclease [Thaumarchaeota archaeon]|nr:DNA repair exonuclease [Nitrososphaerota archaeon]